MNLCNLTLHLPHAVVKNVINIKSEKKIQALCNVKLHLLAKVEERLRKGKIEIYWKLSAIVQGEADTNKSEQSIRLIVLLDFWCK
jgi:hypothetical protein